MCDEFESVVETNKMAAEVTECRKLLQSDFEFTRVFVLYVTGHVLYWNCPNHCNTPDSFESTLCSPIRIHAQVTSFIAHASDDRHNACSVMRSTAQRAGLLLYHLNLSSWKKNFWRHVCMHATCRAVTSCRPLKDISRNGSTISAEQSWP